MIIPTIQAPIWKPNLTVLRLKRDTVRFSDLGREIPCCNCKEWLPADSEFFNLAKNKATGLNSKCRVCSGLRWENNE